MVKVSPEAVDKIADEVEEVESICKAAQRTLLEDLRLADGQFNGWVVGRVLSQLDSAWAQDFQQVDENLEAVADRLHTAATAYSNADGVSADLFFDSR